MRKATMLLIMLSVTALSFSQGSVDFSVTKYGSYEVPYTNNNYYVITFPNQTQTQTQLYTSALMAVTRNFISEKVVVSTGDNVMISVNAIHRFTEGYSAFSLIYDVNYTFQMEFKDGRVKINAPKIERITDQYGEHVSFADCATSSTTGELLASSKREFAFVNGVINRILSSIGNQYSDDWQP